MAGEGWLETHHKIRTTRELAEVYASLGYSPSLEEKLYGMSQFLREENFIADIPDHPAFVEAIKEITADDEALQLWYTQAPSERTEKQPTDHYLDKDWRWKKVIELHESKDALVSFLNTENGMRTKFPTKIKYNPPLVEIKPKDIESYKSKLNILDSTLHEIQEYGQFEAYKDQNAAFENIKWIRKGLEETPIDVFSWSRHLISNLACCFWESPWVSESPDNQGKELLDELLYNLVRAERETRPGTEDFVNTVSQDVKKYLEKSRIHSAWLTQRYIQFMVRHEVALRYPPPLNWIIGIVVPIGILAFLFRFLPVWCGLIYLAFILYKWVAGAWYRIKQRPLLQVQAEVLTGSYSAPELARRLREMERRDIVVSSLLLGLLDQADGQAISASAT